MRQTSFLLFLLFVLLPTAAQSKENALPTQTAYLAGGCFWGMEELLRRISGVLENEADYTGGDAPNVTYGIVKAGRTGHAELVKMVYDSARLWATATCCSSSSVSTARRRKTGRVTTSAHSTARRFSARAIHKATRESIEVNLTCAVEFPTFLNFLPFLCFT